MTEPNATRSDTGGAPLAYLPAAWVAVVVILAIRGLATTWPLPWEYDLPDQVLYFIYAGSIAALVNILWGLVLLGQAFSRSPRFPANFVVWQVANIVWLVATEIYAFAVPSFVFGLEGFLIKLGEIAFGLICLYLVRRDPSTIAHFTGSPGVHPDRGAPAVVSRLVAAIIGVVLGGAAGAVSGLLLGTGIAEATDMSCFEGACGFFAVGIGLLGLIAGAIGGGVFGAWWSGRRRAPAAGG